MTPMTRTERLLRLARQRGDRAAVAILETTRNVASPDHFLQHPEAYPGQHQVIRDALSNRNWRWTEAELRAAWGDR